MHLKIIFTDDCCGKKKQISGKCLKKIIKLCENANRFFDRNEYLLSLPPHLRHGNIGENDINDSLFTEISRLAGATDREGKRAFPEIYEAFKNKTGFEGIPLKLKLNGEYIKLRPHQVKAIKFYQNVIKDRKMSSNHGISGCILKLEMGLGKTLTSICISLLNKKKDSFPSLVIASKTVMGEWKSQGFEKFFGKAVKVLYLHKDYLNMKHIHNLTRDKVLEYDFVITSYSNVVSTARKYREWEPCLEREEGLNMGRVISVHPKKRSCANNPTMKGMRILFHTPWETVIADESQTFCNPTTATYRSMMAIYGKYKICLTGTPIRNYTTDIWSQLRWLGYDVVPYKPDWKRNYNRYNIEHKLSNFILSIETRATDIVLPPKTVTDIEIFIDKNNMDVYGKAVNIAKDLYKKMVSSLTSYADVLSVFMRLRQICIAPYIILPESKRNNDLPPSTFIKNLRSCLDEESKKWIMDKNGTAGIRSPKIQAIMRQIEKVPAGEKLLIFSTFTSALDLIADAIIEFTSHKFEQLDGESIGQERIDIIESFRKNPEVKILLVSYKIGGEGLNLVEANHVIMVEPWWTKAVSEQAEARVHRPGQKKEVFVYNIYVRNTIENHVLNICKEKKVMAENILNGRKHETKGLDKLTMARILQI